MGIDRQHGNRGCLLPVEPHLLSKLPLLDSLLRSDLSEDIETTVSRRGAENRRERLERIKRQGLVRIKMEFEQVLE